MLMTHIFINDTHLCLTHPCTPPPTNHCTICEQVLSTRARKEVALAEVKVQVSERSAAAGHGSDCTTVSV